MTRRFKKMMRKGSFKKTNSTFKSKALNRSNSNVCYKYGNLDHFVRDYPMQEIKWKRNNSHKVKEQKDYVLDRKMQKRTTYEIVKKTLATIGNTLTGESNDGINVEDQSMMDIDDSNSDNENILALIANLNS